jgi:Trypsin
MRAPHRRAMLPTFAFAFLLLSSGIIYLEYGGVSADRRGPVAPPRLAVSGGLSDTEVGATGNPSTAPLKWSGLLVIHDVEQDGKSNNMICTAQFIAPRVVLTAAHCVQDYKTGAWYDLDEMYFLLQYQNGQYSQVYRPVCLSRFDGWFPPTGAQSPTELGWAYADRFQWDYAMILVDHDSTTGYFNWDVDWSGKYQNATMTGYPLAVLNGQIIQIVDGTLHFAPDRHNVVELVHAERTDITQGASGGAWVANFSKEETADHNSVLSVSSYLVPRLPGISFGPYLTADYRKLLDHVSRGCPH